MVEPGARVAPLLACPMAMQMRFLQTLSDVGNENNTTIVFPVPIDLLNVFQQSAASNVKPPITGTDSPDSSRKEE